MARMFRASLQSRPPLTILGPPTSQKDVCILRHDVISIIYWRAQACIKKAEKTDLVFEVTRMESELPRDGLWSWVPAMDAPKMTNPPEATAKHGQLRLDHYHIVRLGLSKRTKDLFTAEASLGLDTDPSDPNNTMGIISHMVSTIFASAHPTEQEHGSAWDYAIQSSFFEIYNEDPIHLLTGDDGRCEVQIHQDEEGHIIWGRLKEVSGKNTARVLTLLHKGSSIRRTNKTDMSAQSWIQQWEGIARDSPKSDPK
ncbi:hypothetical protein B0H10DRAFT_2191998 [Mycena sp. CBHHK59/15]|nr:hypothetical protein B0H10DRAFT_2191998 [Mycena sp. CBHHK59/15]